MRSLLSFRSRGYTSRQKTLGQSLVEFAIVLPVFMLLLLIAVDFGRLFFSYVQISNATREGAAYAAAEPTDLVGIQAAVARERSVQSQRGENALTVTASCSDTAGSPIACTAATGGGGPGNIVTVKVNEPFTFFTPLINGFFANNMQLNVRASATVLGYAGGTNGTAPGTCAAPTASFTVILTSGRSLFADPTASRPNSGTCNISGYNWTWGDGNSEVGNATGNPHTYAGDGTYTITLEVTNQGGTVTTTQVVTFPVPPSPPVCSKPTASFTYSKSGKTYTYQDTSTVGDPVNCPVTDWLWTFTDQGGLQSNAKNPAPVTYGSNSSHPVTLTVTNAAGSSTTTHS
jgi:PKD repeat protein